MAADAANHVRGAVNLAASVAGQIEDLIAKGLLVPGQRLVEADLERQLQVGRMPIREALRLLAGDGLIEIIPNRGARVRSMSPRDIADMLKVLVGLLFVALDDFPQLPDHEGNIARLQSIVDRIRFDLDRHDKYAIIASAGEFETELVRLTRNAYLLESIKRVHFRYYSRQFCRFFPYDDIANIGLGYFEMIEFLREKQIEPIKDYMRRSVRHATSVLYAVPADFGALYD